MKPKTVKNKEALLASVSKEFRKHVQGSLLSEGPFYVIGSKHNVLLLREAKKGISLKPVDAQLVSVSHSITEEAANEIEATGGVVIISSGFHWTEESAKKNTR